MLERVAVPSSRVAQRRCQGAAGATGHDGRNWSVMKSSGSRKTKKQPSSAVSATEPTSQASPPKHVLRRWLTTKSWSIGKHPLHLMIEQDGRRSSVLQELREVVRTHYVCPEIAAQRVADLGAVATAQILRELMPKTKSARSGDLGEVLATEVAEQTLDFVVPVRRLRWKDGRNMALRGDDIVGIRMDTEGKLVAILKGESKSYATLTNAVVEKAAEALDRDRGRPGRHAVLFIATRLRETGKDEQIALAVQLEGAVVSSFSGCAVEHFLFALTGTDPNALLTNHLTAASRKKRPRHAVGVQIPDHADFIKLLFGGL